MPFYLLETFEGFNFTFSVSNKFIFTEWTGLFLRVDCLRSVERFEHLSVERLDLDFREVVEFEPFNLSKMLISLKSLGATWVFYLLLVFRDRRDIILGVSSSICLLEMDLNRLF
jgi:hypothetical protein